MTTARQFLIYQSEDGSTRIDVMLEAETLWLNQKQLTDLFGRPRARSANTSSTSSRTANWPRIQLFGFSAQLNLKGSAQWNTTIWT